MTRLAPVTKLFAPLLADLRRRHLIPVVVAMLAAIGAVPFVLARSASPRALALHASPALPAATRTPVARTAPAPRRHARWHRRPARNPFLPSAGTRPAHATSSSRLSASGGSTAVASTAPAPPAGAAATPAAGGMTETRTVTVTVPTPTPAPPVFTSYAARLGLGPAGGPERRLASVPRDAVLPSIKHAAVIYLGILSDRSSAEFLVSNRVKPSGDGRCRPSLFQCTFLTLRPGQRETLLLWNADGSVSQLVLRYLARLVAVSAAKPHPAVFAPGRELITWGAKLLPSLRTLRYDGATGLLTLHVGVPAGQRR